MSSEKFSLKWNDFQTNITRSFSNLRDNTDFADVTLASEDNHQVEAHKVILSASSPFFMNILKVNRHAHPLIYMKGIKVKELLSVLDFMYHGEADVFQEDLDRFLSIAEEFQLKGLTSGSLSEKEPDPQKSINQSDFTVPHHGSEENQLKHKQETRVASMDYKKQSDNPSSGTVAVMDYYESECKVYMNNDLKELDEKIESMIEKQDNKWTCKVCGKKATQGKSDIRNHIEGKHIEGVSHPCKHCDKTFRSRHSVVNHVYKFHKV